MIIFFKKAIRPLCLLAGYSNQCCLITERLVPLSHVLTATRVVVMGTGVTKVTCETGHLERF